MPKWGAVVVSIVTAFLVVQPAFRDPPRDSYPLSNYPMFAQPLEATNSADAVIGLTAAGERRTLSPRRIAETDEVIQAVGYVYNELAAGRADQLCSDVARRVADDGPSHVVAIQVITERQDAVAYFQGVRDPEVTLHASCEVVR
ncbi:MAG: hypothetical protein OES13_01700 [Acidimicrobiia bacterium]|nr:hypothetical protein [Acidimicrobiia bacterium]